MATSVVVRTVDYRLNFAKHQYDYYIRVITRWLDHENLNKDTPDFHMRISHRTESCCDKVTRYKIIIEQLRVNRGIIVKMQHQRALGKIVEFEGIENKHFDFNTGVLLSHIKFYSENYPSIELFRRFIMYYFDTSIRDQLYRLPEVTPGASEGLQLTFDLGYGPRYTSGDE